MSLRSSTLLILLFTAVSLSAQPDTTRFSVVNGGKVVGSQLQLTYPDKLIYTYEFNDRGRGPKMQAELVLDADGMILKRTATGIDYFKAPVRDEFSYDGKQAIWKNRVESETRAASGKLIYSPISSTPAEAEWWIKLLLRQPNHETAVLPAGKLRAFHVKNHSAKVDGGIPVELELYAMSGLGGPPTYCWLTPKKHFFAVISGWTSVVLAGHENLIDELKSLQDEIEHDYFEEQADKLTHAAGKTFAIEDVTIFNSAKGKMVPHQTVVIENDRIVTVGKASKVKLAATVERIAGKGQVLLPGLWDNHAHYNPEQGLFHLAGGVTNIKDMGNSLDLPETAKKVAANELLGPEISVMSGFIDFAGPYAGPTGKLIKSLDEGKQAVHYYAEHGYQQVKLYSSLPVDWVKPIAEEAHKLGLKVCGHIPSFMTADRAVRDGYDQIIHLNMVMLNFLGDTLDTRSMGRFVKVAERARNIDLNASAVKNFVTLLQQKGVVVDPTAAIFEGMFVNEPGKLAAGYEPVQNFFPSEFRRQLYYGGLPGIVGHEAEYKASYANMLGMLKRLHDGGVTLVPGTDDFPGFALHRELELYVKAGIPPSAVLRAATLTSATVAGKAGDYGTIEPGKKANLILVEGDPMKNISDIRKVRLTIKAGNRYDPKALYQSYGFSYWP